MQIADHDGNAKHQSSSSMPPHVHSTKVAPLCMRCCRILARWRTECPPPTARTRLCPASTPMVDAVAVINPPERG